MADEKKPRFELKPVERRTFLRYSLLGSVGAGLGGFGLASLGFLYPRTGDCLFGEAGWLGAGLGGFGLASLGMLWPRLGDGLFGEVALGSAEDLYDEITSERSPRRFPDGGISVITWDATSSSAMRAYGEEHAIFPDGERGLQAINTQSCPHLGCGVPWCQTSQWFECPCHGSRYNRYGEWTGGPAPRGLDRYVSFIDDDGQFVVDLGEGLTGPARTANALEQSPEGPSCVDA
ncbi:MAG: Rieske 2Fe-2S domain-containing protein [Nitriliruptoraceae bacterium]|nr:Rieske 2Fe-2S domain-containing protein [Nitriliruptoraceae bacterium]